MKKLSAILLLLSLTVPFLGTYLFLQYNKNKIRKEITVMILAGMQSKDLILLKFTTAESETILNWEHSLEFEYKGQMYDIVEQSRTEDTILFTCFKDYKETKLKKDLVRTVSKALGHDPFRKSQNEKMVSFMKSIFSQDFFTWNPISPEFLSFQFSTFIFQFASVSLSPLSPPPKCV